MEIIRYLLTFGSIDVIKSFDIVMSKNTFTIVNRENVLHNCRVTTRNKNPIYNHMPTGHIGEIVIKRNNRAFYGYNGIQWVQLSGTGPGTVRSFVNACQDLSTPVPVVFAGPISGSGEPWTSGSPLFSAYQIKDTTNFTTDSKDILQLTADDGSYMIDYNADISFTDPADNANDVIELGIGINGSFPTITMIQFSYKRSFIVVDAKNVYLDIPSTNVSGSTQLDLRTGDTIQVYCRRISGGNSPSTTSFDAQYLRLTRVSQ